MKQVERHSLASLSNRTGLNRAVLLGALGSGRLPVVEQRKVGSRTVYDISTDAISDFVAAFRARLVQRVEKLSQNAFERDQKTAAALRAVRRDFENEQGIETPVKIAERYSITQELATYLLNKHGQRVEGGYTLTPAQRAVLEREVSERKGARK